MKYIVKILILFIFLIVGKITRAQCDYTGTATVSATGFEAGAGFTQDYFIVDSETGLIVQLNSTGSFTINSGEYTVHAANYDGSRPSEISIGQLLTGVQTYDANTANCFEMINRSIVVCEQQCIENANVIVSAKSFESAAGYSQIYVLVGNSSGNIISSNTTGNFPTFVFPVADVYKVYAVNTNSATVTAEISDLGLWSDIETLEGSDCADIIGPKYIDVIECPVGLSLDDIKLEASALSSSNLLNWNLTQNIDTDHFIVERSSDSKNFSQIGTTKNSKYYDNEPLSETYYRLKVISKDGTTGYSNIDFVERNSNFSIIKIYPNPTTGNLHLNIESSGDNLYLDIVNTLGQSVKSDVFNLTEGVNSITLDISGLSDAMYYISLSDGETTLVEKITKIR